MKKRYLFFLLLVSFIMITTGFFLYFDYNIDVKIVGKQLDYIDDYNYNIYDKFDLIEFKINSIIPAKKFSIIGTSGNYELYSIDKSKTKSIEFTKLCLAEGSNTFNIEVETYFGKKIKRKINVNNYNKQNSTGLDNVDDDDDGLLNYQEMIFGTNKDLADTDSDGLSDYDEIFKLGTNPLDKDTNKNGINDNLDDEDNDKVINELEIKYNSSPLSIDTDSDGISDYDEITKYFTKPNAVDTDLDGISDYDEIFVTNTNPLTKNTNVNIDLISSDNKLSATINNIEASTYKNIKVDNNNLIELNAKTVGYIAGPYTFTSGNNFENAQISYDISDIDDVSVEPCFYYYNEETKKLEEVETIVKDNRIIGNVKHFSTYIVLNKTVYNEAIKNNTELINLDGIDTNNDKLSDELTKLIFEGKITTSTGINPFAGISYEEIMKNSDHDGDGLLNGEEIELVNDNNNKYIKFNSDPLSKDSDNDGIEDAYDLQPLVTFDASFKIVNDMSYVPATPYQDQCEEESNKIYNTVKDGNIGTKKSRAEIQANLFSGMPAGKALNHFLDNKGTTYDFDNDWGLLETYRAKENLAKNTNELMDAIESSLKNNTTTTFASTRDLLGTNYSEHLEDLANIGWWYAIGYTNATMVANVTRNDDNYSMILTYRIVDYYDWNKDANFLTGFGGLVNDKEMYELHTYGEARQYRINITYNMKVTWQKGDRYTYELSNLLTWQPSGNMKVEKLGNNIDSSMIKENSKSNPLQNSQDIKPKPSTTPSAKPNTNNNEIKDIDKINNFKINIVSSYNMSGIKTQISSIGIMDLKNQLEYLKTTTAVFGMEFDIESYVDFKNGITYTSDLYGGWTKSKTVNQTFDIVKIKDKILNDKKTVNLGNGKYKVNFSSNEIDSSLYGGNNISDGDLFSIVTIKDGYISEIVFDFSKLLPDFDNFSTTVTLFDYNKASSISLPNIE